MNNVAKKIVKKRIFDNERNFNKKEIYSIEKNENLIIKIYLLGFLDAKKI